MLQFGNRERVEQVIFAAGAEMITTADAQFRLRLGYTAECVFMLHGRFARQHIEANTLEL